MFAKIKAWFFRFRLAEAEIKTLKEKNSKLINANGILFDKCNIKDKEITKIRHLARFHLTSSMDTKVRVWIREVGEYDSKNRAIALKMLTLLNESIKEETPIWKSKKVTNKIEDKIHRGLSKGFRRK